MKQPIVALVTQLGRVLLALLIQFGAPILALYLFLAVPPLFGCLGHSDRPGPGCYGSSSRVGLAEIGQLATAMLPFARFAARFLWPIAILCTLLALLTKWRPRTQWIRRVLLSLVGFIGTGYLIAAAGWYFALSGTGATFVAAVGGIVAAWVLPRLIAPVRRPNRASEPPSASPLHAEP